MARRETDRELDASVARDVMGWKEVRLEGHGKRGKRPRYRGKKPDRLGRWRSADVPYYSTNPIDANLIPARMNQIGLSEKYLKELARITKAKGLPTAWASAHQLSRAALKAVKAGKSKRARSRH